MSKFKVGDVVKVIGDYHGYDYQESGSVGTVMKTDEKHAIVQFPLQKPASGRDCTEKWRDPELCCEWFPDSGNELELVTPHKSLDIPGYVPPAGWRIKADDELVEGGDAFSHDGVGTLWPSPNTLANFCCQRNVGTAREYHMSHGGYILAPMPVDTPVVKPVVPTTFLFCVQQADTSVTCYVQTEEAALRQLKSEPDDATLYRCVPIAKKTSQITMIGDDE